MGLINLWPRGTAEWTTFAVTLTLAAAKGTASSAAGFLTVVVVVLGCLLGAYAR